MNFSNRWGYDQKTALKPYVASNWSNVEFESLVTTPLFVNYIEEFKTQRKMAIEDALTVLGKHPLAAEIKNAFKLLTPLPIAELIEPQMQRYPLSTKFTIGSHSAIQFDQTGAVSYLEIQGRVLADALHPLGVFQYSTYNQADYTRYALEYNYLAPIVTIDKLDQQKLNIDASGALHQNVNPQIVAVYASPSNTTFLVQVVFPASVVQLAGAPKCIFISYNFTNALHISVKLNIYEKMPTRLPEALFFRFIPIPPILDSPLNYWQVQKLGQFIDPLDVVVGGSRHLHSIDDSVVFNKQLTIRSLQAPLITFGTPSPFPTPLASQPDWAQGVSFLLFNNIWNTNYLTFYPIQPSDSNISLAFDLSIL